MSTQVHTLRIGSNWWMEACAPSLKAWCATHGHTLHIWRGRDIPKGYPHPKFCMIDMLRRFLKSDAETFFYIDADVYINPAAPALPPVPGPGVIAMPDLPSSIARAWPRWAKSRNPGTRVRLKEWTYRNAGIWLCDRAAAAAILTHAIPPHYRGCMDQNAWNYWLAAAHHDGMPIHDLSVIWNAYNYHKADAHFYHLAGKNKERKWNERVARGQIPPRENPLPLPSNQ